MRKLIGILFLGSILWPVGKVCAQVGLYGSPEVLQLPQNAYPPIQAPASYPTPYVSTAVSQQPAAPAEYQPPYPAYGQQWIPSGTTAYGQQAAPSAATAVASAPQIAPAPAPAIQPRNLTSEMLGEPEPVAAGTPVDAANGTDGSIYSGGPADCGVGESCGAGESCGEANVVCAEPACCPWYAGVTFLYMCRNQPNRLWTSYETDNEPRQLPTDINLTWAAGGQATVGYRFGCRCPWGIEVSYWGLGTIEGQTSLTNPNNVSTTLDVSWITFGVAPDPVVDATTYFDNAAEHRLWRKDQVDSVELNLVHSRFSYGGTGCGSPYDVWDFGWGAGVRYFRFKENWSFGGVENGHTFGEGGGIYEAYLQDHIDNNLVGGQVGCDVVYHWRPALSLFIAPRVGVYNNQIRHYFAAIRGDGAMANDPSGSGVAGSYPVTSTKNAVAFLAETDIGLDWRFHPQWSARVGYRVLVATGIGLSDNQIPHYIFDIPAIRAIDFNGELVLHGGFAGLTYNY